MSPLLQQTFDFLDFGCSNGGSIDWARSQFGVTRGLGIDIDPKKVAATIGAGYEAIEADATALPLGPGSASFVTMLHFIEHLPSELIARRCIHSAIATARDFVYVRHPWFDSDRDLMNLGYKFFWSDWRGHTNHFGSLEFYKALAKHPKVRRWHLLATTPVLDTHDLNLIPLSWPKDGGKADPSEAAARTRIQLPSPAYAEIVCIAILNQEIDDEAMISGLRGHKLLSSWDRYGSRIADAV